MKVYIESKGDVSAGNTHLGCDVKLHGEVDIDTLTVNGVKFTDILKRIEKLEKKVNG